MIARAFEALTERERQIGMLLNRMQSVRGLPSFADDELLIKISDFGPMLDEIPDYALGESFKQALKSHDYRQPFQVSEVVTCYCEMSPTRRDALRNQARPKSLEAGEPCAYCGGSGFARVNEYGRTVRLDYPEQTVGVKKCPCPNEA